MDEKTKQVKYKWRTGHQYYATIISNLVLLCVGCMVGWFSPALPKLLSVDTPLIEGPLNSEQVSWLGSITYVGALPGIFVIGTVVRFFGCKNALILLAFPATAFWILVYFGYSYYHLLIAKICFGITGGGSQAIIAVYISEIANNDIRGRLGSFISLLVNVGILSGYIVGALVDYEYIPCIFVIIPLIYLVCFVLIPNTPQFLIRRGKIEEAKKSLQYFKGFKGKNREEIDAFNAEFERLKSVKNEHKTDQNLQISDFTNRKAIKGLIIAVGLMYFEILTGNSTITSYAVYIVGKTGTTLNPYQSSVAIAVMLLVGNLCTTAFVEFFGRKTFMIISLLGCTVGHVALSTFLYLDKNGLDLSAFSWVPVFCLAFIVFISSAGIRSVTAICKAENLPTKIREPGIALGALTYNVTSFASHKLLPILIDAISLEGCMIIFAVNCIVGSLFIFFVLDETRGKTIDPLKTEQIVNNKDKMRVV